MATARPKQARRRAGAASRPRSRGARPASVEKPPATRHRHELAAIACVAAAVFLAFVLYFGWDGGSLGRWSAGASRWLVGLLVYVLPFILCFAAYMLVAREERRPRRGVSWGIALMVAAFLLAAAADSFGVFAGERPLRLFRDAYMSGHGGLVGEVMWGGLHGVVGRVGVDVLVVALFVAGLLLATGSSLRQWASRSRVSVAAAGRAARSQAEALGSRRRDAAGTRVVELDEAATVEGRDLLQTTHLPGRRSTAAATEHYGPAVSTHAPSLIDAASMAPELYAEGPASFHETDAPAPVAEVDDSEQLSLAEAAAGAPDGEEVALAFAAAERRPWSLPDALLLERLGEGVGEAPGTIEDVSRRLVETLGHFGVSAAVVDTVSGPRVTRYEIQLAPGIKVNRVAGLKDDIAYALAATDVRVQAPIPGKQAVGVEVPNVQANYVSLGDIYGPFPPHASPMAFWLGKDVTGKAVLADLAKMVHLLVAGTTGSGKSGCLNALISSLLLRATPDDVRMIMIDPKKVELSNFDGIPHLLAPVVTNMKQATYVLDNICREMDRRYDELSRSGCQDVRALNKKRAKAGDPPMPYIMVIIDELADLMMVAPSEVEDAVIRLGQLGRSAGVHLVVATQRPSVDVVTGMIKTNIPSRIAFAVSSQTDSRIILDQGGAESLLGMGDMLFSPLGSTRLLRVQGALVTAHEIRLVTEHWRRQAKPEFRDDLLENPAGPEAEQPQAGAGGDELLAEAVKTVVGTGAASVALLQRRLRVGYARAGRLIDVMEQMGIISGYDGSKARSVLISESALPATLAQLAGEVPAEAEPAAVTAADDA